MKKESKLVKVLAFIVIMIVIISLFTSCNRVVSKSSDKELSLKTEQMMKEANRQVGMPAIRNFQEKKNLKWIYELCDQSNFICYAYLFNEREGKVGQFLGKCIGYGIPYSTQFSNPEKIIKKREIGVGVAWVNLPQPEPNGVFKPEGLSATWLIMLDKDGNPQPIYVEPSIIVSPFPLH